MKPEIFDQLMLQKDNKEEYRNHRVFNLTQEEDGYLHEN